MTRRPTPTDDPSAYDDRPTIDADAFRRTRRRSVLTGLAALAVGGGGWRWLQTTEEIDNIPGPLRRVHEANESLWRAIRSNDRLAPTFDRSESSILRVNGRHGIRDELVPEDWSVTVFDHGEELATYGLDVLDGLPRTEMTVEHKCIEGWSHIVTWGGVRFSDFVAARHPEFLENPPPWVGMETPDAGFYVGVDWESMLHPQTLLCDMLEGAPLDSDHGAPLRLVTTVKYGIKQIKRIGRIDFTDVQPDDYWHERGYDYHVGL